MADTDLVCIIDLIGRCIMGTQSGPETDGTVHLHNPIIMFEAVDQREQKVHLGINPIFHSFDIEEMDSRWSHKLKMTEKMREIYCEHMQKLRAARSGIVTATSLPTQVRN